MPALSKFIGLNLHTFTALTSTNFAIPHSAITQQHIFNFPQATPVTCSALERSRTRQKSKEFYFKNYSIDSAAWLKGLKEWHEAISTWDEGCKTLCHKMPKIKPKGKGWIFVGQYSKNPCKDSWTRLIKKKSDRISIEIANSNRHNGPKQRAYPFHYTLRCSSQKMQDSKLKWAPVKRNSRPAKVIKIFC